LIEYVGYRGSFRNTTVEGQITGQGLDLGIIDDPIKGRAESASKLTRDKTWSWLTDDFFSRFSDTAGVVLIACLTGDTQVSMADGSWKPMREIAVGDEVVAWAKDGPVNRRVTAFIPQGEDDILELRTERPFRNWLSGVATATTSASVRRPIVMRSQIEGRSASKCQRK
jgi:hypothetical protein